ncbi:hypothetical protein IMG5_076610 [Ichthyophthirius multifiliis]|uniref:Uncharacterized protein n=1 Tax=Ichthyophthirius multifiliis TaxID=5932 RepID=G0QQ71_ICHMU|nr:hypothetical protein IMG5_076610 [Ichthyophthirius multifiliis]EGR32631.1 hypothetical protein IMG5_076610 [Ichthyophthirius multifiliis]|eukprot:XP_004036617.1 hypothetical protein IMG5_076610 [Ichthyophthirius multifiliis]
MQDQIRQNVKEQYKNSVYNQLDQCFSSQSSFSNLLSNYCYKFNRLRVQTAPARPLSDIEEFKRSYIFMILEQNIILNQRLLQTDYQKFDLDSIIGQKIFKKYLKNIQKLIKVLKCQKGSRKYRSDFSKAYRILFKEGELNYLTEIFDSAQEGFPYLYVNGEKFVFTEQVIELGRQLMQSFLKMQNTIKFTYLKICQNVQEQTCEELKIYLKQSLEIFDNNWAQFEKQYINELIIIEAKSRKYIQDAIDIQQKLQEIEQKEKFKGKYFIQNEEYIKLQKQLCKQISLINSIANMEGKGRDDLDFEILQEAENVLKKITNEQSLAVRSLAEKIKQCFQNLREIFIKYQESIDTLDPQLKNNTDLVEALYQYEVSWEKGKNYFLDAQKTSFLIQFTHIIEATSCKYKEFKEQLEFRDADMFLNIPCLLVLKLLEKEDKNICNYFLPQIFYKDHKLNSIYKQLDQEYQEWKKQFKKNYFYYNFLEKKLLNIKINEYDKIVVGNLSQADKIVHKIKQLAIEIQRNIPVEWNNFLDVSLN